MTGWILSHLNWAILDILPWWSWLVLAGIAAGAIMWFVPMPKVNTGLAIIAAVAISGVGLKAWGYQQGYDFRDAKVHADAAAETKRLQAGFAGDATREDKATAEATTQSEQLTKEAADVVTQATVDANGTPVASAPIVIPADVVDRLRSIGQ